MTTKCAFCGRVPTELPHLCLLEKRDAEDARLLAVAFEQEAARAARRETGRVLAEHYNRLVEVEKRVTSAESSVKALVGARV